MLLVPCPYCGQRPEIEFAYGGEAHIGRPVNPAAVSDEMWAEFLYMRSNSKGAHAERWRHIHGCGRFFNAVRHTVSDRFLAAYKVGEPRPKLNFADDAGGVPQGSEDIGAQAAGDPERRQ